MTALARSSASCQRAVPGAKPAAVIFWPWIAAAGINDVRLLSRIAPVIQLTQEPFPKAWPYVKAYAGANQGLIGRVAGELCAESDGSPAKPKTPIRMHNNQLARPVLVGASGSRGVIMQSALHIDKKACASGVRSSAFTKAPRHLQGQKQRVECL